MSNKELKPGLYITATPIGNLGDITLRALDTLKRVDYIACEDSRVTKRLLSAHNINDKKIFIYNDHSSTKDREKIINLILDGKTISLVSDAGSPLISDPGYKLIKSLKDSRLYYTVIPGASSIISSLSLSGLATDNFYFEGFLPNKSGQRQNRLKDIRNIKSTLIFMERSSRILKTFSDIKEILGEVEIVITREITKLYEEVINGNISDLLNNELLKNIKGEIVFLVDNKNPKNIDTDKNPEEIALELLEGNSIKEASKILAKELKIRNKDAYNILLNAKEKQLKSSEI